MGTPRRNLRRPLLRGTPRVSGCLVKQLQSLISRLDGFPPRRNLLESLLDVIPDGQQSQNCSHRSRRSSSVEPMSIIPHCLRRNFMGTPQRSPSRWIFRGNHEDVSKLARPVTTEPHFSSAMLPPTIKIGAEPAESWRHQALKDQIE